MVDNNEPDTLISTVGELMKFLNEQGEQMAKMNNSIEELSMELSVKYNTPPASQSNQISAQEKKQEIMTKIESVFIHLLQQVSENKPPVLRIRDAKSWDNCFFKDKLCLKSLENCMQKDVKFKNRASMPKFALIHFLLGKIYKLLATGRTCTKRELFYQNIDQIEAQTYLDSALNDITCLMDAPLYELNIHTTSKGLVAGDIEIQTLNHKLVCNRLKGTLIPNDVNDIVGLKTDAKFVLLIEKDAIFQKLLDCGAMKNLPACLFVTGKGFPDINTRVFLKKLWNFLHIPILALVDPNPYGIEIMCVYRFGSLSLCHQADLLAVPSIRWLGIFPSELNRFYDQYQVLTTADTSKLKDLIKRSYVISNDKLAFEIQFMVTSNHKAEIEGIETTKGYLANVYIPMKITRAFI